MRSCVCVPEACDVRIVIVAILEKKLTLMFGILGRIQRMRVKDCTANSRVWGRPRTRMFKVRMTGLSRAAWQAAGDGMFGKPLSQIVWQAV